MDDMTEQTGRRERMGPRPWVRSAAMIGGGLVAGGILAGTLTANAATGDTATKVTDVVEAKYPDATIQRVETDSDGVYEAHIVTADGGQLIVQVGEDFSITGTQQFGGR